MDHFISIPRSPIWGRPYPGDLTDKKIGQNPPDAIIAVFAFGVSAKLMPKALELLFAPLGQIRQKFARNSEPARKIFCPPANFFYYYFFYLKRYGLFHEAIFPFSRIQLNNAASGLNVSMVHSSPHDAD
jgi:hypothetical protein